MGRPSAALAAMRAGQAMAGALPPGASRAVGESVAVWVSRLPPWPGRPDAWALRRGMVARHLRRVLGADPGREKTALLVDQTIASYARYWAESLRLPGLPASVLNAGITYEGFDQADAGLAAGRGVILALPHLGGWEWAGTQLARCGYRVSVVVERLRPDDLFEWFVSFRERLGMQVIPAGPEAAARCSQALADNHLLCLLSDRLIPGTSGIEVELFGERTFLPAGPAMLALRTGATLLPAAVYFREATDAHRGVVLPAVDPGRSGRMRQDVARMTQDLARGFEQLIAAAPTQWHLMQPNWPSDPGSVL